MPGPLWQCCRLQAASELLILDSGAAEHVLELLNQTFAQMRLSAVIPCMSRFRQLHAPAGRAQEQAIVGLIVLARLGGEWGFISACMSLQH